MIVLYVLGYFIRNKQNSYAALTKIMLTGIAIINTGYIVKIRLRGIARGT